MDFDSINKLAARQQLELLGGVLGAVDKGGEYVGQVLILVERNIEVVTDGGLRTDRRDIGSCLVEEVGKLARGNKLIIGEAVFDAHELLDDDGFIVRVFLRG